MSLPLLPYYPDYWQLKQQYPEEARDKAVSNQFALGKRHNCSSGFSAFVYFEPVLILLLSRAFGSRAAPIGGVTRRTG
jgi:hypothetical protein